MPHQVEETFHGIVESVADAFIIIEAARVGVLPRVTRRLNEGERKFIRSGSVFVWDEEESGICRWTDGRCWSSSRVAAGHFIVYCEQPKGHSKKRFVSTEEGKTRLHKKVISVVTPDDRKLHLVAYYVPLDVDRNILQCLSAFPTLKDIGIKIPSGYYTPKLNSHHFLIPPTTSSSNGNNDGDSSSSSYRSTDVMYDSKYTSPSPTRSHTFTENHRDKINYAPPTSTFDFPPNSTQPYKLPSISSLIVEGSLPVHREVRDNFQPRSRMSLPPTSSSNTRLAGPSSSLQLPPLRVAASSFDHGKPLRDIGSPTHSKPLNFPNEPVRSRPPSSVSIGYHPYSRPLHPYPPSSHGSSMTLHPESKSLHRSPGGRTRHQQYRYEDQSRQAPPLFPISKSEPIQKGHVTYHIPNAPSARNQKAENLSDSQLFGYSRGVSM